MEDRERLTWLVSQARVVRRKTRGTAWEIVLLYAVPFLAVALLLSVSGRPGIAAGSLALALPTFGLLRVAAPAERPRRLPIAHRSRNARGAMAR